MVDVGIVHSIDIFELSTNTAAAHFRTSTSNLRVYACNGFCPIGRFSVILKCMHVPDESSLNSWGQDTQKMSNIAIGNFQRRAKV